MLGDPELFRDLVAMFQEDYPRLLQQIEVAMQAQNGPELKVAAHTLKGSVGVFKDPAAYDAALSMEMVGRNLNWAAADNCWTVLQRETSRLSALLAQRAAASSPET